MFTYVTQPAPLHAYSPLPNWSFVLPHAIPFRPTWSTTHLPTSLNLPRQMTIHLTPALPSTPLSASSEKGLRHTYPYTAICPATYLTFSPLPPCHIPIHFVPPHPATHLLNSHQLTPPHVYPLAPTCPSTYLPASPQPGLPYTYPPCPQLALPYTYMPHRNPPCHTSTHLAPTYLTQAYPQLVSTSNPTHLPILPKLAPYT